MNVFDTLSKAAQEWPARPAIIDDCGVLDYRSLWREVDAMRQELERVGVTDGCRVGMMGRNGRAFIVGALAALGCGAVVMPIDFQIRAHELTQMRREAGLMALLDDGSCPQMTQARSHTFEMSSGVALGFTRLPKSVSPDMAPWMAGAAFVRYSSGTTGTAKGVLLTHQAVLKRVQAANQGLQLNCHDRVLWVLPMAYHFFVSIVLYLRVGAAIVISPDHWAASVLETAARHQATFLYAAPMQIRALTAAAPGQQLPPSLTRVMSVSSRLDPQSARAFHRRYGVPVSQGYGVIEVGLPIANLEEAAEHPESIGRPIPGYEAVILDPHLRPVLNGDVGQLALRGPGMFAGYLSPPRSRDEMLQDGRFLTGDMAHRDRQGLIVLDGRTRTVINVAGHKVFPEEVAAVLDAHPAIFMSRVVSRPHTQLGEVIHAEVKLRAPETPCDLEEILEFCRRRLTNYKVPATIEVVSKIDATSSGKARHG